MEKDVFLTVRGVQLDLDPEDATEIITRAKYYFKNQKHFLMYDEVDPEDGTKTANILSFNDHSVDMVKKAGGRIVQMFFETGQPNMTLYDTPMGSMIMDTFTDSVKVTESEHRIEMEVRYSLSMNETFVSNCIVTAIVTDKPGDLRLYN